jgi:hypothetical protein
MLRIPAIMQARSRREESSGQAFALTCSSVTAFWKTGFHKGIEVTRDECRDLKTRVWKERQYWSVEYVNYRLREAV